MLLTKEVNRFGTVGRFGYMVTFVAQRLCELASRYRLVFNDKDVFCHKYRTACL